MGRRFVLQMTDGDSIEEVYLVSDKQLRANRNGNLYLQVELRDRTGAISARMWNAGEHLFRSFESGDFLQVKGKVQLFQGALQRPVAVQSVRWANRKGCDAVRCLAHQLRPEDAMQAVGQVDSLLHGAGVGEIGVGPRGIRAAEE